MKSWLRRLWALPEKKIVLNKITSSKPSKANTKYSKIIEKYKLSIKTNGYRSIKLSRLLQDFGYKKIGSKNLMKIENILKTNNLFCFPSITSNIERGENLKMYNYPVRSLGDLFEKEKKLEDYIHQKKAYKQLNVQRVDRQKSPEGTKDRLDFLGYEKNDKKVVIELKHRGVNKKAIEQICL